MDLITWSEALSVNVKQFDEAHKKLIAMINELNSAMGSGKGKDVMGKILTGLADYVATHFKDEEGAMQKHQYPGYPAHKAEHDKLTREVVDILAKFNEGKMVVSVEIMMFLKKWLSEHIQTVDKKYTAHLNGRGVV